MKPGDAGQAMSARATDAPPKPSPGTAPVGTPEAYQCDGCGIIWLEGRGYQFPRFHSFVGDGSEYHACSLECMAVARERLRSLRRSAP